MQNQTIQELLDQAILSHRSGNLPGAERLYRQILAHDANHAVALNHLGVIACGLGQNEAGVELIRRAVGAEPGYAEAWSNLGLALIATGQTDAAISAYRRAIAIHPRLAEAINNLGLALQAKRLFDDAVVAHRNAVSISPAFAEAYYHLGTALMSLNRFAEAIAAYRNAIALRPDYADAHTNLGNALNKIGDLDEAILEYRRSILLRPADADTFSNLGHALHGQGQLDEALAAYRHALELDPRNCKTHSNLLFAMLHHPECDAKQVCEELQRWDLQHAHPLRSFIRPHDNDRNDERRIRIGYVSADFCEHASAHFVLPLFEHHDTAQVELFCYAEVSRPDAVSDRIARLARWRNTSGQSDEQVADTIRADRIDILIDLKLHTADNRLMVFARKPAPIQLCWLGYPGSTGLSAIDYRLSDPYLDPPLMDESVYIEQTVRLPQTFWCYDPLEGRHISVSPLPALEQGFVTFGCLNSFTKISDPTISLFSQILMKVKNSRLLLLAPPGSQRRRAAALFQMNGVDPDRIEFIPRQPRMKYLEVYHRIDLSLDSFPYNGHTTSLDSFWMGVPVVTRVGTTAVSRAGWCQLSNLGLTELAGQTADEFVRIAAELSADLPRLSHLRAKLRQRLERSPLMDAPAFARNIEAAYRRMWRKWCWK